MQTKITIISIGIAIAGGVFLAYRFRDEKANKWRDPVTFLLLIVATVIGVYLAVLFNNIQEDNDRLAREKEAHNEKVEKAKKFIEITRENVRRFYSMVKLFQTSKDTANRVVFFKRNVDIFYPNLVILENPTSLEIISPLTLNQINIQEVNLKSSLKDIDPKGFAANLNLLAYLLDRIIICLQDEGEFQDGAITEVELHDKYEVLAEDEVKELEKVIPIAHEQKTVF